MITADGFFDWAVRDPGPADRLLSAVRTPVDVYVCHSTEGTYNYPHGYTALRDPARRPTAWHWTKARSGVVYQHYPIWAWLQHGHRANNLGPGGELEGFAPAPMTAGQLAADRRIISDLNEWRASQGKPPLVRDPVRRPQGKKRGLVEHREMAPQWNTTQCPSERYAPLWAALEDDMGMTDDERARLALLENLLVRNGINFTVEPHHLAIPEVRAQLPGHVGAGDTVRLVGDSALAVASLLGWSAFLGIGQTRSEITKLGTRINEHVTGHEAATMTRARFEGTGTLTRIEEDPA